MDRYSVRAHEHVSIRFVTLALGRPPAAGAPIHPHNVFRDKRFRVVVGYRKTPEPRGKGKADESLALTKKDAGDFLRVQDLVERLDA